MIGVGTKMTHRLNKNDGPPKITEDMKGYINSKNSI